VFDSDPKDLGTNTLVPVKKRLRQRTSSTTGRRLARAPTVPPVLPTKTP